jgi:hypothetical protein
VQSHRCLAIDRVCAAPTVSRWFKVKVFIYHRQ